MHTYMIMSFYGSMHYCVCARVGVRMFLCVREHMVVVVVVGRGGMCQLSIPHSVQDRCAAALFQDSPLFHETNKCICNDTTAQILWHGVTSHGVIRCKLACALNRASNCL